MTALEWLIGGLLTRSGTRARAESVRAAELLTTLSGKRLAIRVLGTPWAERPLCLQSDGTTLRLITAAEASASSLDDAVLVGAPLSLLTLAASDPEAVIRRGDVRIEGDTHIAQLFRELATLLLPDLEDSLAHLLGRSGAHLAVRGARHAATLVGNAAWTSVQNLAEYLAHESGDVVSRHEAEHFLRGVDELRERLDRLDAHLSDLDRRAQELGAATGLP